MWSELEAGFAITMRFQWNKVIFFQSEKRSCEMQAERLQKEVKDQSEQNTRLTRQVQDLNKEISSLR